MAFTTKQLDTLTESFNIAFGRIGASLSEMTGRRVELRVPLVIMCPLDELKATLESFVRGDVAAVAIGVGGGLEGDALLIVDYDAALALTETFRDQPRAANLLDAMDQDALKEIGNILINACFGTLSNLMQTRVDFVVPRLHLDKLDAVIHSLQREKPVHYALVVYAAFQLAANQPQGYLLGVLSNASVERLLDSDP